MPPVLAEPPPAPAPVAAPAPAPAPVLERSAAPEPAEPEPPAAPIVAPEPAPAFAFEPQPAPKPAAKPATPQRTREPEREAAPAAAAKPAIGAPPAPEPKMARFRTLGNNDITLLDRLFSTEVPGLIAHYVLISSIACNEPATGDDASGYGTFLRSDIESLGRALVHSRMGKAPQYSIAQADLDALALPWESMPPPAFPAPRRLRRDLRRTEWAAISALTQPSERDATLRTRIALLALAGAAVEGVDARTADDCAAALGAYRSAVLAWLVPLCVASAGSTGFVIPPPPATVDRAGRKLVAALKAALAS
jgi:hypothetical protein